MNNGIVVLCMINDSADKSNVIDRLVSLKQDCLDSKLFVIDNCSKINTKFLDRISYMTLHTPMMDIKALERLGTALAEHNGCANILIVDLLTLE